MGHWLELAGNRGTLENLLEGMGVMYVTDVQYVGMQAASFRYGRFYGYCRYRMET